MTCSATACSPSSGRSSRRTTATPDRNWWRRPESARCSTRRCSARRRCTTICSTRIPQQASYAVSMAYRMRYNMQFNVREAIHMLELRSSPQGHPSYRRVALDMHRLIGEQAGHRAAGRGDELHDHRGARTRTARIGTSGRGPATRPDARDCDRCHNACPPTLGMRLRMLRRTDPAFARVVRMRHDD